jgi:hypothetical protein
VERRYAKQLSKLAEYAYDENRMENPAERNRQYLDAIFGAEEIVDAYVWTKSSAGCQIRAGMKLERTNVAGPTGTCLWVRSPGIGHPIVNLWSGRIVEYEALLKDKNGAERGYTLILHLSKMSGGREQ